MSMAKMQPLVAFVPALASAALSFLALVFFSGCYTLKQGTVFLGYLGRAVTLEELALRAGDPAEAGDAEKTRRFVERVTDIRRFAMEELGLAESKT